MSSSTGATAPAFAVEAREDASGTHLRLRGTLDADAAPKLAAEFETRIRARQHDFTICLEDVDMISSAGVGSLIAGVAEARDEGGDVRVVAVSAAVRHVLEMLDLLDYLDIGAIES